MTSPRFTSLVSTRWLSENLGDPGIVVLDVRFNLPGAPTTGAADYAAAHIPGAHFFDIDAVADHVPQLAAYAAQSAKCLPAGASALASPMTALSLSMMRRG